MVLGLYWAFVSLSSWRLRKVDESVSDNRTIFNKDNYTHGKYLYSVECDGSLAGELEQHHQHQQHQEGLEDGGPAHVPH